MQKQAVKKKAPINIQNPEEKKVINSEPQKKIISSVPVAAVVPQEKNNVPVKSKENEPETIFVNGEEFLNTFPTGTNFNNGHDMSMNRTIDTGVSVSSFSAQKYITYINPTCPLCRSSEIGNKMFMRFPCGHWAHVECVSFAQKVVNQHTMCPHCNTNTLDVGNDQTKTIKMIIQNGNNVGPYDPNDDFDIMRQKNQNQTKLKDKILKPIDEKIINSKIHFQGNVNNFLSSDVTLYDFEEKNKNLLDVMNSTGVRSRQQLEQKGLNFHFFTKSFMQNTQLMKMFGINRQYIMSKLMERRWNLPKVDLFIDNQVKKNCAIHPVDFMLRRGFNISDFIDLGWTNEHLMREDGIDETVIYRIFGNTQKIVNPTPIRQSIPFRPIPRLNPDSFIRPVRRF